MVKTSHVISTSIYILMESKFSEEIKYIDYTPPTSDTQISSTSSDDVSEHCPSKIGSSKSTIVEPIISEAKEFPQKYFQTIKFNQDVYEGYIVAENLHGRGFYLTHRNNEKCFYDAQFYMNKLEGYCQIFYENATHFQGLFKEQARFGPGIFSYPDGSQDVGFWQGFKLIRLAVGTDIVPSLVSSHKGKSKILCSRFMIPLRDEDNIITNENVLKYADEIFNIHIRNPRSLFFHKSFYDEQFFGGEDCSIKVIIDEEEEKELLTTKSFSVKLDVGIVERAEKLTDKIKEVKEFVKRYGDIKENLQRKIDMCNECCKSVPEESIHEESLVYESMHTDKIPSIIDKHSQFLDSSIGSSMFISGITADKEVSNISENIESFSNYSTSTVPTLQEDIPKYNMCVCDEEEIEDIPKLEDQLSNVTAQYLFYQNIQIELQKKLDKLNIENSQENIIRYKLVKVNELWAWNNEASMIQMQRHCFKHRNSEDMVNFSVPSLVLGNRKEFGSAGKHEQTCYKFLLACSKGDIDFVRDCLRTNKVHANIADAKGNSAIFYAAAKCQFDIMKSLTNYGAKLDQCNDEQLTPLSMCILKFIAMKNKVDDWEKAFFQDRRSRDLPSDLPKWYNVKSFISLMTMSSLKPSTETGTRNTLSTYEKKSILEQKKILRPSNVIDEPYIFNLDCAIADMFCIKDDFQKDVKNVFATIMALLDHRANPNCCEVPYPALALAMFTESPDLVKELIKAGAYTNITIEDNLSCLHIVSSLPPCKTNAHICITLLKYGCNPNIKTLSSHWANRAQTYKGNIPENFKIEDSGKNALHILCMRTDFELDINKHICTIAKLLLDTDLDINETYLGHTALSLAVLTGNIELATFLATSYKFDPYEALSFGMGNISTLYALKRFDNVLPLDQCKAMLSALCDAGVNLLQRVYDCENAITFAEEADTFFDEFIEKKVAKEKPNKKLDKISPIKEFMRTLARQAIIKQIQIKTTEIFYEFLEQGILEQYEIIKILAAEYLTPSIAIQNLKDIFEHRVIQHDRINLEHVKALLDFVNLHKKVVKKGAPKIPKNNKNISVGIKPSEENMDLLAQKFEITLNLDHIPHPYLSGPGLENPEIYNVCYHCLRGRGKILVTCPRCQVIKFCSSQCNKLNVKLKTQHGCNLVFYDMTSEQILDITEGVCLEEIVQRGREKLLVQFTEKRAAKLKDEEQKLLDMWRSDTYGTKFLQLKPLLEKVGSTIGGKSNWTYALVKRLMQKNFQKAPGDASLYCLESLLVKLQSRRKSQTTIWTQSTRRSTLGGSTLQSAIFEIYDDDSKEMDDKKACKCSPKCSSRRPSKTTKTGRHIKIESVKKIASDQICGEFSQQYNAQIPESLGQQNKSNVIVKKLRKIPARYQRFIEVIGEHFPETDFSDWLLPYACYSDGQLYYKFCSDIFKESYSLT